MTRAQAILAFIAVVALMNIAGHMDCEDVDRQQKQYCEMTKLYRQSNGEEGWPAYNGEEGCK